MNLPHIFTRVVETLSKAGAVAGGTGFVVLMLLATANAIGRKFGEPVPDALEASETIMFASVFLGLAYVALRRGHVNVVIFTQHLSPRIQATLEAAGALLALVVFGLLTWSSWGLAWKWFLMKEIRLGVFPWPVWPFRFLFVAGMGLLGLQMVLTAIASINRARGAR